ncbi:type IV toxin-antitoxin system AbiEi family antitoxin domain-containing protein [Luteipulveratus mongoliensis]|uniref:AbiEi antitoxin C-terminal domain-containing protein n=1 Tax=Luteipulveratus mongoliensis TaxID=571913 RepID=A0A0K1JF47_9MICO|nr:type IV toxin-antitoxin system AbiEi family antitoxin domain-containing protein [Luteipulveratus mongoliensis]AKU15198.1 hypothetical protein VV02_03855 [Luteipulveratus mongoliensis]
MPDTDDDAALGTLALRPERLFVPADARRLGIRKDDLRAWVRRGMVRHLGRGVYAVGEAPEGPEEAHRQLIKALLLGHPTAVASHHSALVLHGLDVYGVDLATAYATWTNDGPTRTRGAFRTIRTTRPPEVKAVDGWATVTPAWAIAQTAARFGVVAGVVSADHALKRKLVTMDDLIYAVAEHEETMGVGRMRAMLDRCDGSSESVGESRLRLICEDSGSRSSHSSASSAGVE